MTASVGQAPGMAVQLSPGGARPPQRGGAGSGFDRLLGPAARNHGHADGKAAKVEGAGPHGHERGRGEPEEADALIGAARAAADAGTKVAKPSGLDDSGEPETGSAGEGAGGDDEKAALPMQIKAEQTISALMAMTPAARRPEAEGGEARAAALDALTGKSQASRRALEAVGRDAPPAAAQGGADAVAGAGMGAAQAQGRAGRAHLVQDGRDGGNDTKAGKPAPMEASASQPDPGKAAAARGPAGGKEDAGGQPDLAGGNGGKAATGARRGGDQASAAKVSVIAQQAAPAPAPLQLGANAAAVVAAVAGEQGLHGAAAGTFGQALAFRDAQPMRSLKLELHPAELGTVTVNLRTSGEHMSVELRVENHDAYERLSADSDAIVQSLRSLGYEIDGVSIQQPQAAAAPAARADQNAAGGGFSRDASSFHPGNSGGGSERSAGQNNGQGSRNDAPRHDHPREFGQDRAGGSLYI